VDLEVHSRLTTAFSTLTLARNRVSFWLEDIFWRRGLASHLVFFNRSSGSFHFYDRIADLFGVGVSTRQECRAALQRACRREVQGRQQGADVCIGFACSELGQERMLTPRQWVAAFHLNLRPGQTTFAFLGGPGDRDQADRIITAVQEAFPQLTLHNACGKWTLKDSVAVLFASPEFWGIDSSLLHLARIVGLRCISYWGPTDPATRLRDWGLDEQTYYRKIACSPCVHTSEEPPCRGDNRCIQGLFSEPGAGEARWTPMELPQLRYRRRVS
jgi:ADP-heptose:LPS heptosyltransferase